MTIRIVIADDHTMLSADDHGQSWVRRDLPVPPARTTESGEQWQPDLMAMDCNLEGEARCAAGFEDGAERSEAVRLFMDRAREARSDVELGDDDLAASGGVPGAWRRAKDLGRELTSEELRMTREYLRDWKSAPCEWREVHGRDCAEEDVADATDDAKKQKAQETLDQLKQLQSAL